MSFLKGHKINLRGLEPEDLEFVHMIENDTNFWHLSNTITPLSKFAIKTYLESASEDIYTTKQLRLVIETIGGSAVGLIDLFDFDPYHKRAGLGIIIHKTENQQKGAGSESIALLIDYAKSKLQLHQLYCNIMSSNVSSIALFEKLGFEKTGEKKDWCWSASGFENEYLMQKIL